MSFAPRGSRGFDVPALTCGQVLDAIAHQIAGVDLEPFDLDVKRARVRELLRNESYLIVLDNIEVVPDCGNLPDWFWTMTNPSKLLLTSRHWLESDVGAAMIPVEQLSELDSLALVRHEAGLRGLAEVVAAGDDALQWITAVTGGNPLAIRLVVGQLVSLPLDRVLTQLETAQPDTDSFYQYLYGISWDLVSGPAQHLLLEMVQLPANGGSWEDLAGLTGLSGNDLASALQELVTHSLVQVSGFEEKTYCLHPLTYHFAVSQAAQSTSDK
jgi:hypothetical protein